MAAFKGVQKPIFQAKRVGLSQYRILGAIVAGVTLALAVASIALSIRAANELYYSAQETAQSQKRYDVSAELLLDVLDMETGVRGYVITDDADYLEPYRVASQKIAMHMALLKSHFRDTSESKTVIDELDLHVSAVANHLERVIAARRELDSAAAQSVIRSGQGKPIVDKVRELIGRFQNHEKRRYAELTDATNQSFSKAIATAIAAGLCVISFILFYFALTKHFNQSLVRQTALAISNEKNYRTLVDNAPIGIAQFSLDGSLTEANKLLCDLLQSSRESLITTNLFDMVLGDDRDGLRRKFDDLSSGSIEAITCQHRIVDSKLNKHWVMNALSLLRDDSGEPRSIVSAMVDESDQRSMEIVQKRMLAIVNGSNDAIISKNIHGIVTSWNPAAEKLFGYTEQEMIGESVFKIIPEELRNDEIEMLERCAAGQTIVPGSTIRLHRDGHRIDVLLNVMPLIDTTGASLGVCTIIRDLTSELQAAANLDESERRFRMLAENMSQFAWIANAEGWIYWYNKRWYDYTGTTLSDMEGWGWTKVHHPDHVERVVAHLNQCWKTGTPWEDTFPLRGQDGNYRWFLSRALPIRDGDGAITNWFGSNTDITEIIENEESLKKARKQAENASRARGEFLANMSHEIRTPMTAILGHADILAEHIENPDDIQNIATIRRSAKYLLQIINDILDLSKIDSGKFKTEAIEFSPSAILHELRSLLDVRADEKRLTFEVSIVGKIPRKIVSDPVRLRQILVNLAGNAIKFTDRGRVDVICSYVEESNKLRIAVRDTGIGISGDFLPGIFQPFIQADTSSTRAFEGTGLGLAISRRLACALNGDITVQSTLGEGSTFALEISCGVIPGDEWIEHLEPPVSSPSHDRFDSINGTILVVDDRRDIRYLVQNFLEKAGATVVLATNGLEAIDYLKTFNPIGDAVVAVVMDMQMPVLDGYTAAKELRELGFEKPIIALTANAMKEDREKCLLCGCNDYATKPLDGASLVHLVASNIRVKQ